MSELTALAARLALAAVLVVLPFYLDGAWLLTGLLVMTAAVGAIGLNLLVGSAGQLSLAHGFFIAVGAYAYCLLAGDSESYGGVELAGFGLPPLIAVVLATLTAGLAGLLFSPVAGRIRGLYLGLASLALVFLGQHLLLNLTAVTGGYNGRRAPELTVGGFQLSGDDPPLIILGVPFGDRERLWYVTLLCLVAGYVVARRILAGRPGRALVLIRENETAAAAMGIHVGRYKGAVFVLSSMYAGLAGVLVAVVFQRIVPDYFGLMLSIDYLAMIIIGGLGSVRGAIAGAAFVAALPVLLSRYGSALPFLAQPGESGVDPGVAARLIFGVAVVLVLIAEPGGLTALVRRSRRRNPVPADADQAPGASPAAAGPSPIEPQLTTEGGTP